MVRVVVTGVSGFIAGPLSKLLVQRGHQVIGTVRSLADETKVSHLRQQLPQVQLFEADLLKDGSFDDIIKGAEWVFHTASPFFLASSNPQKELVEPALNGTLNVLNAVEKAGTVKRVVLTSSIAAVASLAKPEDYVHSEEDWNLDGTLEKEPYRYSKRVAEEAAWNFAKGKSWDLVVINPGFVLGAPLSARTDSTSVKNIKELLDGTVNARGGTPGGNAFPAIDVRDVVEAHVRAAENPKASGRYLLGCSVGVSYLDFANVLAKKFPKYPIPTKELGPVVRRRVNNSKVQNELGIKLIPWEQSIVEMAQALIDLGIVQKIE